MSYGHFRYVTGERAMLGDIVQLHGGGLEWTVRSIDGIHGTMRLYRMRNRMEGKTKRDAPISKYDLVARAKHPS